MGDTESKVDVVHLWDSTGRAFSTQFLKNLSMNFGSGPYSLLSQVKVYILRCVSAEELYVWVDILTEWGSRKYLHDKWKINRGGVNYREGASPHVKWAGLLFEAAHIEWIAYARNPMLHWGWLNLLRQQNNFETTRWFPETLLPLILWSEFQEGLLSREYWVVQAHQINLRRWWLQQKWNPMSTSLRHIVLKVGDW